MPPINIIEHARDRMKSRGISESEVIETIRKGIKYPAKHGRLKFVKDFSLRITKDDKYTHETVIVIADKINDVIDVISVYQKFY